MTYADRKRNQKEFDKIIEQVNAAKKEKDFADRQRKKVNQESVKNTNS